MSVAGPAQVGSITGEIDIEDRVTLLRRLGSLIRIGVAVLLCLTPATAILVMGWLMRTMRRDSAVQRLRLQEPSRVCPRPSLPNWLMAPKVDGQSFVRRFTGSMIDNCRLGVASLLTLAAGTLPFALLWLFSWWGGWENSFNKGYEQAWVGPAVGLLGVLVALPLLTHLPMALAHQAAEGRMSAYFAFGHVRRLIRHASWRYLWLCFLIVVGTLPLFVSKSLPVFVENWSPGFVSRNQAEVQSFATSYRLATTIYLVLFMVFWRRAAARLYARASLRLKRAEGSGPTTTWLGNAVRGALVWIVWFGLVAQIFVGQFVQHQWVGWINQPSLILPWVPLPGTIL